ncbi:MAG: V-type ATPase 116kDa subunit family protein [Armatimonadota bacterium]|nr:V-type ATPase 116kDa subunit family protein [Armatimonadota bacterium]
MIVEMSRLLIVGPRRLLNGVIDEVQRVGAVHIDRIETDDDAIRALALDDHARAEQARLEALHARLDGLAGLLPPSGGEPAAAVPALPAADDLDAVEAAVAAVEAEVHGLSRRRLELDEEFELIRTYEGAVRALAPLMDALAGSRALESVGFILRGRDLTVVAAVHNQLRELTDGRVEVVSRAIDEGKIGVVVAFLKRDADAVRGFLSRAGIAELRLPARYAEGGPAEAIRLMEQRRAALPGERAEAEAALAEAARRHRPVIDGLRALVADRLAQLHAAAQLGASHYVFILHGWTPTAQVGDLRAALRARFGGDVVVEEAPADPHRAAEVPVLLDNPPAIKPFQRLLGLFKPPRYGSLDPTLALALFFPLFVGIVIGDVAYGAILFSVGWFLRNKARGGAAWIVPVVRLRMTPPVLADVSWIIRVMAVWTMLFGVLYLEIFGDLVEHATGWHPIFHRIELATAFFKFAVALGVVQVTLGNILHLLIALRHRHTVGVLESLALICGVVGLVVLLGAMGNELPRTFFAPGLVLLIAFFVFFLAGFALDRFAAMWLLEAISGMGNVLSYARLFGVGLAAAVLANVSNELGGRLGPVWVGIIVGILIQMIFFLFTLPGHLIQPARLNWVEFLTKMKYHDETGNSYRPLQKTGGD